MMDKKVWEIFNLLERKNSYLLEFHKINNSEIDRLSRGCIENLENFYRRRENLLKAIGKLDSQFQEKDFFKQCRMNETEKEGLNRVFQLKNEMIQSILDQDVTILSLVNQLNEGKLPMAG